jgi:Icc-related predicted phosphoesterase
MKALALTDIHGNTSFLKKLGTRLGEVDLVILCGDLTHFGHRDQALEILGIVREHNSNVIAVSGNCDYPDVEATLLQEGLGLHGRMSRIGGFLFGGVGGSLPAPGHTPNELTEEEIERMLRLSFDAGAPTEPFILVSHQPPRDTKTDRLPNGIHVGSFSVRSFIEDQKPLICFTGHIHEGRGVDTIAETIVINPGPARNSYYAEVDLSTDPLDVRLARL